MKLSEMFIGQIVMMPKSEWKDPVVPVVGKVVDITYEHDFYFQNACGLGREIHVRPVVHFLGEDQPRAIDPGKLETYKE